MHFSRHARILSMLYSCNFFFKKNVMQYVNFFLDKCYLSILTFKDAYTYTCKQISTDLQFIKTERFISCHLLSHYDTRER